MLAAVNSLFQIVTIVIGTFMIERYVLLEPSMEYAKQRIFYIISVGLVFVTFAVIGENAQYLALVFGGLNIFLGRKKRRLSGFLMVIPLIGVMDGLVAAPLAMAVCLMRLLFGCSQESTQSQLCLLLIYLLVAVFLIAFYFKGKNWRIWFEENMKDRKPSRSEYILIFTSGVVVTVFTGYSSSLRNSLDLYAAEVSNKINVLILFFEAMAFLLTVAIVVLVMQGNKRKFYHDKVSGMQFSVIATMADIVENRDSNTGGHIKRTARYVEIIGNYMLSHNQYKDILSPRYLADMVVAAPLHDIGKISIPDSILNKPGKLTDEEFEIMKTHTTEGRGVLKNAEMQLGGFDYLEVALDMAEYHHEWYNGKGYPAGISGDEIPLCARIMAVADVFDALTSKRCYKDAMPLEKAYGIIASESGTHFDPVVAEAFLNSKPEIEQVIEEIARQNDAAAGMSA